MRIYIEPAFLNEFLVFSRDANREIEILWNIINYYEEVVWVFNDNVAYEDFEKWETSTNFYSTISSKPSNSVELKKNFEKDINYFEDSAQILLTEKEEDWHKDISNKAIILTIENFQKQLKDISLKFTFRFISDQNNSWEEFEKLHSSMIKRVTITDKYLIDKFIKNKQTKVLDSYSNVLQKFLKNCNLNLDLLVKSIDVGPNQIDELNEKFNVLSRYFKQNISSDLSLTVINAELKGDFDFHDRNIITNFYIIKAGKGFEKERNKNSNTEIECYSFLDKWGYDLIRHRKKMIQSYLTKIETVQSTFKIYQS